MRNNNQFDGAESRRPFLFLSTGLGIAATSGIARYGKAFGMGAIFLVSGIMQGMLFRVFG